MELLFKQHVFSWLDKFDIYDENENLLYQVKGKIAFGHKLFIYDMNGNVVGRLRERLFTLRPQFKAYENGQYVGRIIKRVTFFVPKFKLTFADWKVVGNLFAIDYHISSGDKIVASISKKLLRWGDTYSLDIFDPKDALRVLMVVLAIDSAKETRARQH